MQTGRVTMIKGSYSSTGGITYSERTRKFYEEVISKVVDEV